MSRARHFTAIAALGLLLVQSGCLATKATLNRRMDEERAAREAAIAAERNERLAADERNMNETRQVALNVSQLRTDLASLDTDFGAKIAMLEQGMQIQAPVHFAFDQA